MMQELADLAVEVALGEVGVREVGRNKGQRVEEYQTSVGMPPGNPWCAAFVYWCFNEAAKRLKIPCPLPKAWAVNKYWRSLPEALRTPAPRRGMIFIRFSNPKNAYSTGHTGIVRDVMLPEGRILTVEGNTGGETAGTDPRDREGDGVYQRSRSLDYVNMGYLDVAALEAPRRPGPDDPTPGVA